MIDKVHRFIIENNMLQSKDKVVLGVSGGADSTCLFFVMLQLREIYGIELFVVHINHGIRGIESDNDEQFVKSLCEKENITYQGTRVNIREIALSQGISEEEAGRNIRYDTFYEVCAKYNCNKIAVAHNMNDSAETFLFHLFRGSGIKGLTGISAVRGVIIRPLLCVKREEIEMFLNQTHRTYRTDATNFLDIYTRNKIRLNILPYVTTQINKKATEHIINSAVMLHEIEEYIDRNTNFCYNKMVKYNQEEGYSCFVLELMQEDIVIQKSLMRKIIYEAVNKLKDIEVEHIDMILSLLTKGVGKKVDLPYNLEAVRSYDKITISVKKLIKIENSIQKINIPGDYCIPINNQKIHFEIIEYKKNLIIPKNSYTKWFDYDKIKNTVFIRTRNKGDFIQIDKQGNRKKIKALFIDEKVPRVERDKIPLLADGDHIIWVIGGRMSEAYKVNEETKRILIVKVCGGN